MTAREETADVGRKLIVAKQCTCVCKLEQSLGLIT